MEKSEAQKIVLDALKHNSEMESIEFKDARQGLPRSAWKTVSAFSHRPGGGLIVFGVEDDKAHKKMNVLGCDNVALLQEKLGDLVNNEMSFTIRPEYHILDIKDKTVLAAYISECPDQYKPCYYKTAGMPNGAYIRDGNTDRKMTDDEMRKMIENSKQLKFDKTQAEGTTINELSREKIFDLLQRSSKRTNRAATTKEVSLELMKNLGLVGMFKKQPAPTVAGYLIFAQDRPQNKDNFSRYIVRCVKYKGSNVASDIIDNLDVDGTLDVQIDTIQNFILRNVRKSAKIVGTKRVEKYEYPEKAIREVVANAIIHRDYKITETYTQVNLFEDRIEIFNPGSLAPGVTIENIKDSQVSRNEIIAARLKELDYLEEYGRGIDIVFTKMEEWGLLPPLFKNTANSFKVILAGDKLSGLNERQVKIWEHLVDHKRIAAKECEDLLVDVPRNTINYDLRKMQDLGLIEPVGESKSRYYIAKF